MSKINVNKIMLDPMIAGTRFIVVRRNESVTEFGKSVVTEKRINAVGSIVPMGDQSLVREEAYEQQLKGIRVITSYRLRGAAKDGTGSYQPDLVLWNGNYFLVRSLNDYSVYGWGFVDAECVSFAYVPPPPPELKPAYGKLDFSRSANSGLSGTL